MTHSLPTIRDFAVAAVPVASCPIRASLGVLGRKWALLVLRDVTIYENVRFSDLLKNNPGLTPRMLSFRLKELQGEGLISRIRNGSTTTYALTDKGRYAIPILTAFMNYGIRYHANTVFPDGKPRRMGELLPGSQCEMLGSLKEYAEELPATRASHLLTAPRAGQSKSRGTQTAPATTVTKPRAGESRRR